MDLPNDEALRWIVKTFAHLRAAHGTAIGAPPLLQPTGEFFPDEFRPDGLGLQRLLQRMLGYAPLSSELGVELAVFAPEEGALGGGCGSAACGSGSSAGSAGGGSVQELESGYRVLISAADVANADVLAASFARSVGALVLHEASEPVGAGSSELAAVVCGFGVLLANGASVWAKSWGGLRMAQATVMPVEELAVALALFVAIHGYGASKARKHLGVTQRDAFDVAVDWVDSNRLLVEALRDEPLRLQSGALDLQPVRGVLGQWLHNRKRAKAELPPMPLPRTPAPAMAMTEERRRRLARMEEVNALLDLPDS